ncbi:hypothetical protein ZHAS_00015480 [Anopheles sinensis]|uniref:Uncharacterized protein n=1 Tax=Anopheles sinensis TaxID=74873 RepID=A0A084WBC7_ANOSI|nr:hypothetical protein ZHAS_00015480 [Anopheles sinensis]
MYVLPSATPEPTERPYDSVSPSRNANRRNPAIDRRRTTERESLILFRRPTNAGAVHPMAPPLPTRPYTNT